MREKFSGFADEGWKAMKHILLVDDDASYRVSLREILAAEGYGCEEAQDGEAGLKQLARGSFDLVISDLFMPRASGFDLLRGMAENNLLDTTPVIVTTGELDEKLRQYALGFRASSVLVKPYQVTDLLSIIANTISAGSQIMSNGRGCVEQ